MWIEHPTEYFEKSKLELLKNAPLEKLIEYLLLPRKRM